MSEWTKAFATENFKKDDKKVVDVNGTAVLVVHHCGEYIAMDNACPHMKLPLQIGRLDDECTIHCPWHRSAFDLRSGDVKDWAPWPPGLGPMLGKIRRERALPIFATKVEDGYIWIGPQLNADEEDG